MSDDADFDPYATNSLGQGLDEAEDAMTAPRPGDAITQSFSPEPPALRMGADGLPVEIDPPWTPIQALPIPLSPRTLACMEQPDMLTDDRGKLFALPKCQYYFRQRVHSAQTPDRPLIERRCSHPALRGLNGSALVIDDAGIFECEFRCPPVPNATAILDAIDADKIKKGTERLNFEKASGKTMGYRMFRTPEDVALGRHTLDEKDITVVDADGVVSDPLGEDKV